MTKLIDAFRAVYYIIYICVALQYRPEETMRAIEAVGQAIEEDEA